MTTPDPAYEATRHWLLHLLLRNWAAFDVGNITAVVATRERRTLQRRMVELRKHRRKL